MHFSKSLQNFLNQLDMIGLCAIGSLGLALSQASAFDQVKTVLQVGPAHSRTDLALELQDRYSDFIRVNDRMDGGPDFHLNLDDSELGLWVERKTESHGFQSVATEHYFTIIEIPPPYVYDKDDVDQDVLKDLLGGMASTHKSIEPAGQATAPVNKSLYRGGSGPAGLSIYQSVVLSTIGTVIKVELEEESNSLSSLDTGGNRGTVGKSAPGDDSDQSISSASISASTLHGGGSALGTVGIRDVYTPITNGRLVLESQPVDLDPETRVLVYTGIKRYRSRK